jgi:tRNA-splicing ligase RtcB
MYKRRKQETKEMLRQEDIHQLTPYQFEIPASYRSDMRVAARFFTNRELLPGLMADRSLEQLVNTATLPGVVGPALAMPDIHQGYGFPIGGVVATRMDDGVISPGGVGYDINCGVRLMATRMERGEVSPYLDSLVSAINAACPSGVGKGGAIDLGEKGLDRVLETGSRWALKSGMATEEDLEKTEAEGCLEGASAGVLSQRARERGRRQMGTLGSGNHFIEIDEVAQVVAPEAARQMGLFQGQVVVQIHCGSRGLGHQVCSDYVNRFHKTVRKYGIQLPDRELVAAPLESPEGRDYLSAMNAAANFAFANRQVLAHRIREILDRVLAGKVSRREMYQIYDIAHNMAKIETHTVGKKRIRLCVHRKGATRAFGPGSPEIPPVYRNVGQPVLVPGSMGTASWVLAGTRTAMETTFGSCCHGAGRILSRSQAKKRIRGAELREKLESSGIHVRAGSMSGLAEEAPQAYKDVDQVVSVVDGAGIAGKVARLVPLAVIKG